MIDALDELSLTEMTDGYAEILAESHQTLPAVHIQTLRNHQMPSFQEVDQHLQDTHISQSLREVQMQLSQFLVVPQEVLEVFGRSSQKHFVRREAVLS